MYELDLSNYSEPQLAALVRVGGISKAEMNDEMDRREEMFADLEFAV